MHRTHGTLKHLEHLRRIGGGRSRGLYAPLVQQLTFAPGDAILIHAG